jgi:hypothetical protein
MGSIVSPFFNGVFDLGNQPILDRVRHHESIPQI